MRIAYVCADPGVPVFGSKGCSVHVQEVIRALLRRGAEVEIHAARVDGAASAGLESVAVFPIARPEARDARARVLASRAADASLLRTLARRPSYDAVYERHSLFGTAAMGFAASVAIPGILEVNAPLVEEQARHRDLVHRELAEASARRACGSASLLIAVSEGVASHLRRIPGARDRVRVVPNGVDAARFAPSRPRARRRWPDAFTVGFVGSLKPWHGLGTLVEAFARLVRRGPETRLLIVGDGPERESLGEALAERGLLASTHLTGAVDPAEVPGWMHEMDVGVAPYPASSGFYFSPLKIFEYMAAGLAIAASRVGQIAELLEHDRTGLLCAPGDPDSLAEALGRLRDEPDLRARLSHEARTTAVRRHTWDAVVARVLDLAGLAAALPARAAGR